MDAKHNTCGFLGFGNNTLEIIIICAVIYFCFCNNSSDRCCNDC